MTVQTYGIPVQQNTSSGGGGGSSNFFGNIASSLIGGIFGGMGARRQNRWNARQAQIQRDWQQYMSNTAVSRRMADMANAGVNPVLAARFDASTPPGALAHGASNIGAAAVSGAQNATQIKVANKQMDLLDSQIGQVQADTQLKRDTAFKEWMLGNKVNAEIGQVHSAESLNRARESLVHIDAALKGLKYRHIDLLYGDIKSETARINFLQTEFGLTRAKAGYALDILGRVFTPTIKGTNVPKRGIFY